MGEGGKWPSPVWSYSYSQGVAIEEPAEAVEGDAPLDPHPVCCLPSCFLPTPRHACESHSVAADDLPWPGGQAIPLLCTQAVVLCFHSEIGEPCTFFPGCLLSSVFLPLPFAFSLWESFGACRSMLGTSQARGNFLFLLLALHPSPHWFSDTHASGLYLHTASSSLADAIQTGVFGQGCSCRQNTSFASLCCKKREKDKKNWPSVSLLVFTRIHTGCSAEDASTAWARIQELPVECLMLTPVRSSPPALGTSRFQQRIASMDQVHSYRPSRQACSTGVHAMVNGLAGSIFRCCMPIHVLTTPGAELSGQLQQRPGVMKPPVPVDFGLVGSVCELCMMTAHADGAGMRNAECWVHTQS